MTELAKPPRLHLDAPLILGAVALVVFTLTRLALVLWTGVEAVPPVRLARAVRQGAVVRLRRADRAARTALWLLRRAAARPHPRVACAPPPSPRGLPRCRHRAAVRRGRRSHVLDRVRHAASTSSPSTTWSTRTRWSATSASRTRSAGSSPGCSRLGLVVAFALRNALDRADRAPTSRARRIGWLAAGLLLPAVALSAGRVEQMGGSGNAFADELAGNGLFTFVAAARRNELDYDRFYATIDQDRADHLLKELGVERKPLSRDSDIVGAEHEEAEEHLPIMPATPRHRRDGDHREHVGRVRGRVRRQARPHAEPRPARRRGPAVRELLRHRHAHRARPRSHVARHAARPRPGDRAPPGQRAPRDDRRDSRAPGLRHELRVRRLRLLRQHERVLRRERLPRGRPHRVPEGVDRLRQRLGRGRRVAVRQRARRHRRERGATASARSRTS